MPEKDVYKRENHSCYLLSYHLVIVTKYRHKVLNENISRQLIGIAGNIFEDKWGCEIKEINTDWDHIHILFEAPPSVQLSKLINNFKTVSSRLIRKDNPEYLRKFFWKPYFWSDSYFIGTVGEATEEVVKHYIKYQQNKRKPANSS